MSPQLRLADRTWLHVLLGTAVLLVPALINGHPFWFYDTFEYHALGESIVKNIADVLAPGGAPPAGAESAAAASGPPAEEFGTLTYVGGRSPLYSLALYVSYLISGSYWGAALMQCLIAAWIMSACLRAADLPDLRSYGVTLAVMMASPLPIFAAMMMPDVFTGFTFALLAVLFVRAEKFILLELAALLLVAAVSVSTHLTNIPLSVGVVVFGAGAGVLLGADRTWLTRRVLLVLTPIVLAMLSQAAFLTAVRIATGQSASSAPYLMARVLADGPGRLYLRDVCAPTPQFEICRYADAPNTDPNVILWSDDPSVGVFTIADVPGRMRLIGEERRFVLGAVTRYPLEQLRASAAHIWNLAFELGGGGEIRQSHASWAAVAPYAPASTEAATRSLTYRGVFPFLLLDALNAIAFMLSAAYLAWRLTRPDVLGAFAPSNAAAQREAQALALVGAALLLWLAINLVLCGALSGPFPRYQTRTVWLAPLLASVVFLRLGRAR